jgi:hypothetical protein
MSNFSLKSAKVSPLNISSFNEVTDDFVGVELHRRAAKYHEMSAVYHLNSAQKHHEAARKFEELESLQTDKNLAFVHGHQNLNQK